MATDELTGQSHTLRHAHDELGNRTQTVLPQLPGQAHTERALNYLHYGSQAICSYVPLARLDARGDRTEQGGLGTQDDATPQTTETIAARASQAGANDQNHSKSAAHDAESRYWAALNETASQKAQALRALKIEGWGTGTDGPQRPAQAKIAEVYYFHTDQVGLPEELSNSQGQLVWQASYKTWGSAQAEEWKLLELDGGRIHQLDEGDIPENEARQQNLRFQGQYLDRDTGLHYNTFRYYDPDIGRFISPDPIGLEGGINLGSYSPNPVYWADPLGLESDLIRYKPRDTVTPSPGTRGTAINRAWAQERELVRAGGGTRNWSDAERKLILETKGGGAKLTSVMSEAGYTGHHINSVEGNGQLGHNWKGDPRNIVFLQNSNHPSGVDEHLTGNQGHRGNYQNNGRGRLIDRAAMARKMPGGC